MDSGPPEQFAWDNSIRHRSLRDDVAKALRCGEKQSVSLKSRHGLREVCVVGLLDRRRGRLSVCIPGFRNERVRHLPLLSHHENGLLDGQVRIAMSLPGDL